MRSTHPSKLMRGQERFGTADLATGTAPDATYNPPLPPPPPVAGHRSPV